MVKIITVMLNGSDGWDCVSGLYYPRVGPMGALVSEKNKKLCSITKRRFIGYKAVDCDPEQSHVEEG